MAVQALLADAERVLALALNPISRTYRVKKKKPHPNRARLFCVGEERTNKSATRSLRRHRPLI
jgi:hypothetical protein